MVNVALKALTWKEGGETGERERERERDIYIYIYAGVFSCRVGNYSVFQFCRFLAVSAILAKISAIKRERKKQR